MWMKSEQQRQQSSGGTGGEKAGEGPTGDSKGPGNGKAEKIPKRQPKTKDVTKLTPLEKGEGCTSTQHQR